MAKWLGKCGLLASLDHACERQTARVRRRTRSCWISQAVAPFKVDIERDRDPANIVQTVVDVWGSMNTCGGHDLIRLRLSIPVSKICRLGPIWPDHEQNDIIARGSRHILTTLIRSPVEAQRTLTLTRARLPQSSRETQRGRKLKGRQDRAGIRKPAALKVVTCGVFMRCARESILSPPKESLIG